MDDYSVFTANNQTGLTTQWSLEYRFSTAYGLPNFSGASVKQLLSPALRPTPKARAPGAARIRDGIAPGQSLLASVALETDLAWIRLFDVCRR